MMSDPSPHPTRREFLASGMTVLVTLSLVPGDLFAADGPDAVQILQPCLEPVLARAQRTCRIEAQLQMSAASPRNLTVELTLPFSVKLMDNSNLRTISLETGALSKNLAWNVRAEAATTGTAQITVSSEGGKWVDASFPISFTAPVVQRHESYVPEPQPVATGRYLVGAMQCPLWKQDPSFLGNKDPWLAIKPYREREPVLGFYHEGEPQVTDWEIKYAVEHGIQFFVPCWYRAKDNLGQPVKAWLEHWLKGFPKSRYAHLAKFALLWENINKGACGVRDENDLIKNVLSYWIEQYFHSSSYLLIDGKPVVFVYGPKKFADDLGGSEKARVAVSKMRDNSIRSGFKGLILIGCDNSNSLDALKRMADLGFDCSFSYHLPTLTPLMPPGLTPDTEKVMTAQKQCWDHLANGALPNLVTVSMGWDSRPWHPEPRAKWQTTPAQFESLCRQAKDEIDQRPEGRLDHKMLLLDNWNEFGEGHYIFPTRRYGFGYLDAVREVFAPDAPPLDDIVPEDVGLGPFSSP